MAETTPKASPKASPKKATAKAATPAKPVAVEKPVAAAKSVAAAVPKPVVAKAPAKKPETKGAAKTTPLSDEQRYRMVAEAAYYRAERNQFKSDPLRDWIDAESDISALLGRAK